MLSKICRACGLLKPTSEFSPNKKGGLGVASKCRPCRRAHQIAYRAADPDRYKQRQRKWVEKDRGAACARWYADPANADRHKARVSGYKHTHPERHKQLRQRKDVRRRQRQRTAFVEYVDLDVLYSLAGGRCGICGDLVDTRDRSLDHIMPLSRGGEHSYANTQLAHRICNFKKGARLPQDGLRMQDASSTPA